MGVHHPRGYASNGACSYGHGNATAALFCCSSAAMPHCLDVARGGAGGRRRGQALRTSPSTEHPRLGRLSRRCVFKIVCSMVDVWHDVAKCCALCASAYKGFGSVAALVFVHVKECRRKVSSVVGACEQVGPGWAPQVSVYSTINTHSGRPPNPYSRLSSKIYLILLVLYHDFELLVSRSQASNALHISRHWSAERSFCAQGMLVRTMRWPLCAAITQSRVRRGAACGLIRRLFYFFVNLFFVHGFDCVEMRTNRIWGGQSPTDRLLYWKLP